MKIACFIPIKGNSKRVLKKNTRLLGSKPLFRYALDTIIESKVFDDVYVDTDSDDVKRYCINNSINVIDRDPELAKDTANGNHLLEHWINIKPDYDFYFQIFITAPFIKIETIQDCVSIVQEKSDYDSVFTGCEEYVWYWFDNKPINYNPKVLPRTQDSQPIVKETTSLYGISKENFLKNKSRVGDNPKIYMVDRIEGVDIDTELDFSLAEHIYWKKNERR